MLGDERSLVSLGNGMVSLSNSLEHYPPAYKGSIVQGEL